jgi:hypothetical protein
MTYSIQITIREETSTTSNDRPHALPPSLRDILERNGAQTHVLERLGFLLRDCLPFGRAVVAGVTHTLRISS